MRAAKEKAPTRQRQGFGVNHYEAIHMGKDSTIQHTGNTTSASRRYALNVLNSVTNDIAQGNAPDLSKRTMVSVLFEEAVSIYEKGDKQQHELAAVLLGVAATLVLEMVRSGEIPLGIATPDNPTRH
ncbi:hypothetical protein [Stutzerimonas nitrititolerans]|uniref:hypothetical protein n=1 Tax=Stutzerimonas nitrititolerans TaxID=2482751 RepID=UPI0028A0C2A3|nr:hypothetical protein [Stutzerimonas nitrititolerans]